MKKIPLFKGYLASTDGQIFSKFHNRFLKQSITNGWYAHVHIMKNGKPSNQKVHRLIAITFLGIPKTKMDVNHKNGIKYDNRVENLEWVTRSENAKHAVDVLKRKIVSGKFHPMSKPVFDSYTGIFYDCTREAAIARNIPRNTVKAYCRNGKFGFSYC